MSDLAALGACQDVIESLIAQLEFAEVTAAMRAESNVTSTMLAVRHQLVFDILDGIVEGACVIGEQVGNTQGLVQHQ